MIYKGVLLLVLTITLASCSNDRPILSGTYFSCWYETSFEFTFQLNGDFKIETGGHFGETTTTGRYTMLEAMDVGKLHLLGEGRGKGAFGGRNNNLIALLQGHEIPSHLQSKLLSP